jgi:hypothetical protein
LYISFFCKACCYFCSTRLQNKFYNPFGHTVSNCGVAPNKVIQTLYNDSRTKYSGAWSVHPGTSETMTSTETCKWMLCLVKSRGLHKTRRETPPPWDLWGHRAPGLHGHCAQTAGEKMFELV